MVEDPIYQTPPFGTKVARLEEYLTWMEMFSPTELSSYLSTLVSFLEHPGTPLVMVEEARHVAVKLGEAMPEIQAIFGSGYPYYVLDLNSPKIPELSRYYKEHLGGKVRTMVHGFTCPDCVSRQHPADFSDFCKPCGAPFKAIDGQRAIPDLDLIVVLDVAVKPRFEKLADIFGVLFWAQETYNEDMSQAIRYAQAYMESVLQGKPATDHRGGLHVDLVGTDIETISNKFSHIASGDLTGGNISYISRRYRRRIWFQCQDELAEDIFMSGPYPLYVRNQNLITHIDSCRSEFALRGSIDDVFATYLNFLNQGTDGKYARMIESSPPLQTAVKGRIAISQLLSQK